MSSKLSNVITFGQKRKFSIEEARELLPIVYRLTETSYKDVRGLMNRLEAIKGKNASLEASIEASVSEIFEKWQQKIKRLGLTPKGLWIVDFDNGNGYYCWKYPETNIDYFHGYNDGFFGRQRIELNPNEKR